MPPVTVRLVSMVAACAMAAAACGEGPGADEEAGLSLHVLGQPTSHVANLNVAYYEGFFEDEGLSVNLQNFPSGTTALEAFRQGADGRSGFGDVVGSGSAPSIRMWAEMDGDFVVFASGQQDCDGFVAVASSEISSGEDLRGQTIGTRVGSAAEVWMGKFLEAHGLTTDDVEVVNLDQPSLVAALDRGDIAGFFLWEPSGVLALETSGDAVHYLARGCEYGVYSTIVYGTWRWVLEEKSEAIEAFLRGMMRADEFIEENPGQVAALYEEQFDTSAEGIAYDLGYMDIYTNLEERFRETIMQDVEALQEWGELDEFDFAAYLDPGPMTAVAPDRVAPVGE